MTQEEKELLLQLLLKAKEECLLNIYDLEGTDYVVERVFVDKGVFIKIRIF